MKLQNILEEKFQILKNETKVFCNISCILEKIKRDGNFNQIYDLFDRLITTEVVYAIKG